MELARAKEVCGMIPWITDGVEVNKDAVTCSGDFKEFCSIPPCVEMQ